MPKKKNTTNKVWTKELDQKLTLLWMQGYSATRIGALMSDDPKRPPMTKNSIIGRVHRLDLPRRKVAQKPAPPCHPAVVTAPGSKTKLVAKRRIPVVAGKPKVRPVRVHGDGCRYIFGEATHRNFCGRPIVMNTFTVTGARSWCDEHAKVVYQAQKKAA